MKKSFHLIHEFGVSLVSYVFIQKGFDVEKMFQVMDLVVRTNDRKLGVFVSTRRYKKGRDETRGHVFKYGDINRYLRVAKENDAEPVVAHVVCDAEEKAIHLFMTKLSDVKKHLDQVKHGYRLRFVKKYIDDTISLPFVDYSHWENEKIGDSLFD